MPAPGVSDYPSVGLGSKGALIWRRIARKSPHERWRVCVYNEMHFGHVGVIHIRNSNNLIILLNIFYFSDLTRQDL